MAILVSTRIDWNVVLRNGNQWYDRLVEAGRLPRARRLLELDKIDRDLVNLGPANQPAMLVGSLVSGGARSALVADSMLTMFLPAVGAAASAGDRAAVQLELTRTAAALAAYRATHQQYPDELAALLAAHLGAMPTDLYSGNPFLYERRGEGYLLYSVFENGADDGGTDFEGRIVKGEWVTGDSRPRNGTDLVVRVPRRKPAGK
jgi:hypothetical protein